MFRRFVGGIRRYLKQPLTLEECRTIVADAEQRRDDNFLTLLRRGVYANPRSPYRRLLEHVGIEYGDVERDVRLHGVEASMERLYSAGVRLSFDEFKGNKRIERPGFSLSVKAEDFDNPLLKRDFEVESGGSAGARRRMAIDLDALVYDSAVRRLFYEAAGVFGRPHALWRPVPPGSSGIKHALRAAKFGRPVERWFSPTAWQWTGGHVAFGPTDIDCCRDGPASRGRCAQAGTRPANGTRDDRSMGCGEERCRHAGNAVLAGWKRRTRRTRGQG